MITYVSKWWLLNRLADKCISGNSKRIGVMADIRELVKQYPDYFGTISEEKMKEIETKEPNETFIRMSLLIGAYAERKWFKWLFKDQKKEENRKKRFMAKYKKLLEEAESEKLVRFMDAKDVWVGDKDEKYLAITGTGYTFSRIDSLVHQIFFDKYKGWVTFAIMLLAFFFKDYLIGLTSPISPWW